MPMNLLSRAFLYCFSSIVQMITVAILHICKVNGMKYSDIENVLGQIENLRKESISPQHTHFDQSLEREELPADEYQELIRNIARSPQVQIGFPYKDKDYILNEKDHRDKNSRYRYWPWRQYIYVKPAWLKSVYTPRKLNNNPLNDIKYEEYSNNNLGDYSKVYLVLDPEADITESDVKDLSNVVSSVLTSSGGPRKKYFNDRIQNKQYYKGFIVKDNRRRMRDSSEMYAEKDSIERDYKPKRTRGDYGGGVSGGRTPIPYIRHRGDIFEKE